MVRCAEFGGVMSRRSSEPDAIGSAEEAERSGEACGDESREFESTEAHEFLLAEFEGIQSHRDTGLSMVESRLRTVLTVLTGAVAAFGFVAANSGASTSELILLGITLGIPILGLSYVGYVRTVEFQVMSRVYLRSLNLIRLYYVDRSEELRGYVLQPIDPNWPKFDSVGDGGSLVASYVGTMLGIVVTIGATLVGVSLWWVLADPAGLPEEYATIVAAASSLAAAGIYIWFALARLRRRLAEAERKHGGRVRELAEFRES
jgi:hypothetical protein